MPPGGATKVAGYRIDRDGITIATTATPDYADDAVSGGKSYDYAIAAFDARGRTSPATSINVTTLAASPNGDAPYCPSDVVKSITWHWSDAVSEPNGSDLWPVTWGKDGNVYAFFGDGGGFGGSNSRGRTSFGIAMITGSPPPTAAQEFNIYGGYRTAHPATLAGKAGSIIAVGANFYAIAEIYRPADSQQDYPSKPSGSPNHIELAYSLHDAFSWRDVAWSFCSADASGKRDLTGPFCPVSFVNFGKGNAGAPDGFVYLLGVAHTATQWTGGVAALPTDTFLVRVSKRKMLVPSAYWYFAGLNRQAKPIWTADPNRMAPIFRDRNAPRAGCSGTCNMTSTLEEVSYDAALHRYIGIGQGDYLSQSSFYDAPNLWGPWTSIAYNNIDAATGIGGWANLGTAAGDSMGLHPVNAWTSGDGKTVWFLFSSNGKSPEGAAFPPPGTSMDSFNLVRASLDTTD
jgi:hypothetical protein